MLIVKSYTSYTSPVKCREARELWQYAFFSERGVKLVIVIIFNDEK